MKPKIKYVKEPIEDTPGCKGAYNHKTKEIYVRLGIHTENAKKVIRHEKGHYYIDKYLMFPCIKHYANFLYECIMVIVEEDKEDWGLTIRWYYKYYRDHLKERGWVY